MSLTLEQLGIGEMSVPERMELIGMIWDSITDAEVDVPLPEWHRRELERRLAASDANPDDVVPWEEVQARLRNKP